MGTKIIESDIKLDARHTATIEIVIQNRKVPINKYLYDNLLLLKEAIINKFDGVGVFDGMEGSGKTEMAFQCALVMDPTFNDKDVFYTTDQFEYWLDNSKPGKAGIWDEFALAGLSEESLKTLQTLLIKKFILIRKKTLFIGLVIPYIFMLKKYFAIARSRFLIQTYTEDFNRGYFKFYSYAKKKRLFMTGHKMWDYDIGKVFPNFVGTFFAWSHHFVDDTIIQAKKDKATDDLDNNSNAADTRLKMTKQRTDVLKEVFLNMDIKNPYDQRVNEDKYICFVRIVKSLQKLDT